MIVRYCCSIVSSNILWITATVSRFLLWLFVGLGQKIIGSKWSKQKGNILQISHDHFSPQDARARSLIHFLHINFLVLKLTTLIISPIISSIISSYWHCFTAVMNLTRSAFAEVHRANLFGETGRCWVLDNTKKTNSKGPKPTSKPCTISSKMP